MQLRDNIKMNL